MNMALTIEYIPTNDLIPYAMNSRKHSDVQVMQIAASIKEFGFNNPILIDETETIIACLLYTSPSPRDGLLSRMPSSA